MHVFQFYTWFHVNEKLNGWHIHVRVCSYIHNSKMPAVAVFAETIAGIKPEFSLQYTSKANKTKGFLHVYCYTAACLQEPIMQSQKRFTDTQYSPIGHLQFITLSWEPFRLRSASQSGANIGKSVLTLQRICMGARPRPASVSWCWLLFGSGLNMKGNLLHWRMWDGSVFSRRDDVFCKAVHLAQWSHDHLFAITC